MKKLSVASQATTPGCPPRGKLVLGDLCWTNYSRQVPLCNAEPKFVTVTADNDFLFDADALEAAITPKTKAFIVKSPANPTDGVGSRAALEKLAALAVKYDLWVISDEVYRDLVYDGDVPYSIATLPGMKERTIYPGRHPQKRGVHDEFS